MAKGATYEDICMALHLQYAVLVAAFAEVDPAGSTDCEGWTVADLETHVAITARGLVRIAEAGADGPVTGGLDDWARQLPGFADELDAMAKAERLSLAPQAKAVRGVLERHPQDRVVAQLTGRHSLRDAALFRLVEAVVHGLDAAISPDGTALRIVVKELARMLAERHPGKSVEVRIPPYTAVQCMEGPQHTRGTPPNVVEADAVAFVRLCAGRDAWADLVRTGRVRASGERSDLSAQLPLLS